MSKLTINLAAVLFAILVSIILGSFPTLFSEYKGSKLDSIKVHLSDDVMISMRAGQMLEEIGAPRLNRSDISQPSTSYLAPYIFRSINNYTNNNSTSVLIYAAFGLLSVAGTFFALLIYGEKVNSVLIVILLSLTSTNLYFVLNGWDHLIQGFLLTLSTIILIKKNSNNPSLVTSSVLLACAILMRPDSGIIGLGLVIAAYLYINNPIKWFINYLIPLALLVGIMLYAKYFNFGYFTPTTARLKIGAYPDIARSMSYFLRWGLGHFTAITISIISALIIMKIRKKIPRPIIIILGFIAINVVYAVIISDVFMHARMFWVPACLLSAIVTMYSPSIINIKVSLTQEASNCLFKSYTSQKIKFITLFIFALVIISVLVYRRLQDTYLNHLQMTEPSQYKIARWIDENLDPNDGSIGMFYLGYSFHLKRFEVADFLGKGDETIANSEMKYGPPGHNKWDINTTLQKWSPQVIIPAVNSDTRNEILLTKAIHSLKDNVDFGFIYELILNPQIKENYAYCYIKTNAFEVNDYHGFYVKKSLLQNNKKLSINCD